jgi:hypothetical protein
MKKILLFSMSLYFTLLMPVNGLARDNNRKKVSPYAAADAAFAIPIGNGQQHYSYLTDRSQPLIERISDVFYCLRSALEPPPPEERLANSYIVNKSDDIEATLLCDLIAAVCRHRYDLCKKEVGQYTPCFITIFDKDPTIILRYTLQRLIKERLVSGSKFQSFRQSNGYQVMSRRAPGSRLYIESMQVSGTKARVTVYYYKHGLASIRYHAYLSKNATDWTVTHIRVLMIS